LARTVSELPAPWPAERLRGAALQAPPCLLKVLERKLVAPPVQLAASQQEQKPVDAQLQEKERSPV
jgi:hypothetical protein